MTNLKSFFWPLFAFFILMVGLLFLGLFLTHIGNVSDSMAGNVTAAEPTANTVLWGWAWVTNGSVVKMLCIGFFMLFGLFWIGKEWLKNRNN